MRKREKVWLIDFGQQIQIFFFCIQDTTFYVFSSLALDSGWISSSHYPAPPVLKELKNSKQAFWIASGIHKEER